MEGVKHSREKWRGCGNPYIHTGKSDSLSPPDKSPSDKCGQAGEEPSFSNDGVQDSDKDEALLGEMGERGKEALGWETQPTAMLIPALTG